MDTLAAPGSAVAPLRFARMFDAGWDRVERLMQMKGAGVAPRLWAFLARHANRRNVVIATQEFLATELGVSVQSIRRASDFLERDGAFSVKRVGQVKVYVLDARETLRCSDLQVRHVGLVGTVLLPFSENPELRQQVLDAMPQAV